MGWMQWVVIAVVFITFVWAVGIVLKFNRLQHELAERTEQERRAFKSLLVTQFKEAKSRGDVGAARAVQMHAFSCGIDVEKEAAWSRAS